MDTRHSSASSSWAVGLFTPNSIHHGHRGAGQTEQGHRRHCAASPREKQNNTNTKTHHERYALPRNLKSATSRNPEIGELSCAVPVRGAPVICCYTQQSLLVLLPAIIVFATWWHPAKSQSSRPDGRSTPRDLVLFYASLIRESRGRSPLEQKTSRACLGRWP